jgi:hypothetical protein
MEVDLTSSSSGEILPLKRSTDILPAELRTHASSFLLVKSTKTLSLMHYGFWNSRTSKEILL